MNQKLPALLVSLAASKADPALKRRGDRKLLVTEVYKEKETLAQDILWTHESDSGKCPVQVMDNIESAVFTEVAKQTRHYHKLATEIYIVIEGEMKIEVEGQSWTLAAGDMIVVNPGVRHEVLREGNYLCRVITANSGGLSDRYED